MTALHFAKLYVVLVSWVFVECLANAPEMDE